MNIMLIKSIFLDVILLIVAINDYRHKLISNKIILFTLLFGIIFSFKDNSTLKSALLGMVVGGGIMFLLAMVPNSIGGGDIKLMFVLGIFLGVKKIILALLIAFICASIVSLLLVAFKIKGLKEYIPLGPFLALGSFIAYHFF